MSNVPFEELPGTSRLWIFPVSRPLTHAEEADLLSRVDAFLEEWTAHGRSLTAGRDWREGRFLLIAVDESTAPPTGCSIDAMTRVLKELEGEWGVSFLDHAPVWYRAGEGVEQTSRNAFKELASAGEVTLETPVFDNAITRLDQLRAGDWEKPAGVSWHQRAFFPKAGLAEK